MSDADLASASRDVLDRLYAQELSDLRARFSAARASGRASTDLAQVARAATIGAVDTLFADIDTTIPGHVDEASGSITTDTEDDARDYGVIDELTRRTWLAGGRVLAVRRSDIPEESQLAAILRYAV